MLPESRKGLEKGIENKATCVPRIKYLVQYFLPLQKFTFAPGYMQDTLKEKRGLLHTCNC